MNEKQLQALIRKNMSKVARPQGKGRWQDPTVATAPERDDADAKEIFKEMKKREF